MDMEDPKNEPHQIILALNLTAFKFIGILIRDFLGVQSNSKWGFSECKIGPNAKSRDEKTIKGLLSWRPVKVNLAMLYYTWSCLWENISLEKQWSYLRFHLRSFVLHLFSILLVKCSLPK